MSSGPDLAVDWTLVNSQETVEANQAKDMTEEMVSRCHSRRVIGSEFMEVKVVQTMERNRQDQTGVNKGSRPIEAAFKDQDGGDGEKDDGGRRRSSARSI